MTATDQLTRLYDTVFNRAPDPAGLQFWAGHMANGLPLKTVADLFTGAPEFASTYGQPDNRSFVQTMYRNVLGREGEALGVDGWARALDAGTLDRSSVVVGFSESQEHVAQMAAESTAQTAVLSSAASEARGGPGRDTLLGGAGQDTIRGYAGDDELRGEGGDDVLFGGEGGDYLNGGAGADVLRFEAAAHMAGDYVQGFEPGLDRLDFGGLGLLFRGQGAFEASGVAQLRYVDEYTPRAAAQSRVPGSTQVYIDANGDGTADAQLTVEHRALTDANFLF